MKARKRIAMFLEKLLNNCFRDVGLADPKIRNRNISGTHWIALPNVRKFSLKINDLNSVCEHLGIKKRNAPDFIWEPYPNGKFNGYMDRQIRRLRSLNNQPLDYMVCMYYYVQ